ncbi:hypothetical protein VC891_26570, partial [Citrobacter freundii]|nr:hypothetical protein [Citrobacter freundii]
SYALPLGSCLGAALTYFKFRFLRRPLEVRNMPCFPLISACHQVVNVYKHGDGDAHQKLVNAHPEYYSVWQCEGYPQERPARHEELEVSEEQFREFAEAITVF